MMIAILRWFFYSIDRRPSPTRHLPPLNSRLLSVHLADATRQGTWRPIIDRTI